MEKDNQIKPGVSKSCEIYFDDFSARKTEKLGPRFLHRLFNLIKPFFFGIARSRIWMVRSVAIERNAVIGRETPGNVPGTIKMHQEHDAELR